MKNKSIYILSILGIVLINCPSVFSQSLNPTTTDSNFQSNEENSNGSGFGNSFNPLDLIHRASMIDNRDTQEFQKDSTTNINSAAAEFKKLQLERLKNQQSESSNNNNNNNSVQP